MYFESKPVLSKKVFNALKRYVECRKFGIEYKKALVAALRNASEIELHYIGSIIDYIECDDMSYSEINACIQDRVNHAFECRLTEEKKRATEKYDMSRFILENVRTSFWWSEEKDVIRLKD